MGSVFSSNNNEYENDPYLNNPRDRQLLNSIYSNNQSVLPQNFGEIESPNVNALIDQQKVKKTKTYKNPVIVKRNTFTLEKDAFNHNKYYIGFVYTSLMDLVCNIYLNAQPNPNGTQSNNFIPSQPFRNNIISVKCPKGNDVTFPSENASFDIKYFLDNRIYDKQHSDVIIELVVLKDDQTVECIYASFCKIVPENKNGYNTYKLHCDAQKLKVKNIWFDMHDVYGFTANNEECEICCANKRNTIFLPCKHSYACNICAINIRLRGNNCPICRNPINDSLIIETADDKKKTETSENKEQ